MLDFRTRNSETLCVYAMRCVCASRTALVSFRALSQCAATPCPAHAPAAANVANHPLRVLPIATLQTAPTFSINSGVRYPHVVDSGSLGVPESQAASVLRAMQGEQRDAQGRLSGIPIIFHREGERRFVSADTDAEDKHAYIKYELEPVSKVGPVPASQQPAGEASAGRVGGSSFAASSSSRLNVSSSGPSGSEYPSGQPQQPGMEAQHLLQGGGQQTREPTQDGTPVSNYHGAPPQHPQQRLRGVNDNVLNMPQLTTPTSASRLTSAAAASVNATMYIQHVIVPPGLRGRGLGEALGNAAFEWARARGFAIRTGCEFLCEQFIPSHAEKLGFVARQEDGRGVVAYPRYSHSAGTELAP